MAMFCNELQIRFVEDGDALSFLPYVSKLVPFERVQVSCLPSLREIERLLLSI